MGPWAHGRQKGAWARGPIRSWAHESMRHPSSITHRPPSIIRHQSPIVHHRSPIIHHNLFFTESCEAKFDSKTEISRHLLGRNTQNVELYPFRLVLCHHVELAAEDEALGIRIPDMIPEQLPRRACHIVGVMVQARHTSAPIRNTLPGNAFLGCLGWLGHQLAV